MVTFCDVVVAVVGDDCLGLVSASPVTEKPIPTTLMPRSRT